MILKSFKPVAGKHAESNLLANALNYQGIRHPKTGKPLSEAICFGIAGGIGAGYSFCPSMLKYGTGCGVSIVGRHKIYSTDGAWVKGFAERLGFKLNLTETTATKKAFQNLIQELNDNRPVIIYTSRHHLPFLATTETMFNVGMHSFLIYGIDETKEIALGIDLSSQPIELSLSLLGEARASVCSHKNRTIAFATTNEQLDSARFQQGIRLGIQATVCELLRGRMKTFSLPGFEIWAKSITNEKAADGWLKLFTPGLIYDALRNVFGSIETEGTGGGLFRFLYADFLDEAASELQHPQLTDSANEYRALAEQWRELAETALPDQIKPFKRTKALMRKSAETREKKGSKGQAAIDEITQELRDIQRQIHTENPWNLNQIKSHLATLREQILDLHQKEINAAEALEKAIAA